jgi:hypothetical protein
MITHKPPRSEAFWLALVIASIHAALLLVLVVIAWRSPFMLFRLPEKSPSALASP